MKDNRSLVIKGIILGAIVALLIFKFAMPNADGPAELSPIPNQATSQQEATTKNQSEAQTNDQIGQTAQKQEKAEPNNGSDQSATNENAANKSKTGQVQQNAKSEKELLPVWLLFRSTTCIPCVEMQKTMDALQSEFQGKVDFVAIDVNDSANQELLEKYQIRYIPTTYLYDRNKKQFFQQVGAMSVEDMRSKLQELVEVK